MINAALKEVNELKAKIEHLSALAINCCDPELAINLSHELKLLPEQCLKQHNLALLNSLKDNFINSNQSCEGVLATMIYNLELEK